MRKWIALLLALTMLIGLFGCAARNADEPEEEEETVREKDDDEDDKDRQKKKDKERQEEQKEEETDEEAETEEEAQSFFETVEAEKAPLESPVGIWSSEDGIPEDPVLEYHNYYVCLFHNGAAIRYGWRLMDVGTWIMTDDGAEVVYDRRLATEQGIGWTQLDGSDTVTYRARGGILEQTSSQTEGEFSVITTYHPANRTDAYLVCIDHLDAFLDHGYNNWFTQFDLNQGHLAGANLWDGLESHVYNHLLHTLSGADADALADEEAAWTLEKAESVEAARAEFEGGSMATMVAAGASISSGHDRTWELLRRIDPSLEEGSLFADLPESFVFTSGAGGWSTTLSIAPDGSFTGSFMDSNMGETGDGYPNGTVYICSFSGSFSEPVQVTDTLYSMQLVSLSTELTSGTEYIENDIRYIASDPYGLDNAGEFLLYLPGHPTADMADGFLSWAWLYGISDQPAMPDGWYGLYNVGGEQGFVGSK